MRKFPAEFADLLTPAGRRVLDGADAEACGALANPRRRFIALAGMIEPAKAEAARRLLDRALHDVLTPMADPIPPETIWEMTENYGEWLPKTMRLRTAYLERRGSRAPRGAAGAGRPPPPPPPHPPPLRAPPAPPRQRRAVAVLRPRRLCRAAQRPPPRRPVAALRLHRLPHQPGQPGRGASMARLCRARPLHADRERQYARGHYDLPAAVLALHDAARRPAGRSFGGGRAPLGPAR